MTTEQMDRRSFFALLRGLPHSDLAQIQDAYWLAKNAHRHQASRDDGGRYFDHPRQVAVILINKGHRDKDLVTTALLHDVVEDTNTPLTVIVNVFPDIIWEWLYILSKSVPFFDPITGQLHDRTKKPLDAYYGVLAEAETPPKLVKLADRLHNLGTMGVWAPERQAAYVAESRKYLLPIAERTDPWFAEAIAKAIADAERTSVG